MKEWRWMLLTLATDSVTAIFSIYNLNHPTFEGSLLWNRMISMQKLKLDIFLYNSTGNNKNQRDTWKDEWKNKSVSVDLKARERRQQRGEEDQRHRSIFHKQLLRYSILDNVEKRAWRPVSPTFQIPSPSMKSGVKVCRGCSENKPNSITAGAVTAVERADKIT